MRGPAKDGGDPLYQAFLLQRKKARVRGIAWELEFWQWHQIWSDSGRLDERGTKSGQWVMGRFGDRGPYAEGNVAIIRAESNDCQAALGRHLAARSAGRTGVRKARKSPGATAAQNAPGDVR